MAGQRVWFGRDAWLTSDPKVQEIGALHGAEGALVFEEILALAKISKHQAGENIRVSVAVVGQRAFTKPAKTVRVIDDLIRVGLLLFEHDGTGYYSGKIPRWSRWNDPNAAKRKADSRSDVTDSDRDIPVTVTAMSQRTGTGTKTGTEETSEANASDPSLDSNRTLLVSENGEQHAPKDQPRRASDREDTPEIVRLCSLLADLMEANGSNRPTDAQQANWRRDVRLMLEQDGRQVEQIEAAIRWSQSNDFWRGVVLSMGKVRGRWDAMRLQASRSQGSKVAAGNLQVARMLDEQIGRSK